MDSADPRGSKRKADDADTPLPPVSAAAPQLPRRIKPLDQVVVNKIAAGEIIVAPVHALKELIENSVDAGSTSIDVLVKDGGLKLLQISDNGHGIDENDLPILCERFTTSKLQSFEDLQSIGTYGFRGEALASISHIAHLTITTRTASSPTGLRAMYSDSKLIIPKPGQPANPKPVHRNKGTQITVEDLFYNVPSRRRAFRSPSEEYTKILDLVGRYAVHCGGVAFSCKKFGDADVGVSTTAGATITDRTRRIHGNAVANELLPFEVSDDYLGFKAKGMLSNANYHVKKTTLLLFINNRSVDSSPIRKGIESTYAPFLPKGGHPFAYMSLDIEPHRVDVNVHPTKREVNFLHEEEIVRKICESLQEKLAAVDTSRSYALTQTLLPSAKAVPSSSSGQKAAARAASRAEESTQPLVPKPKKAYDYNMVRADTRDRKITTMLQPKSQKEDRGTGEGDEYEYDDNRQWTSVKYQTIKKLRKAVWDTKHKDLCELFHNHTFVGIVDEQRRLAAVQHGLKLYLIDYAAVAFELFYQIGLSDFSNYGTIRLNPPLALKDILEIAIEDEKKRTEDVNSDSNNEFDWDSAYKIVDTLVSRRDLLKEYFSMEITEQGELVGIPLLLKGYMPSLGKLPSFILRLGPNVDWYSELECFDTFLRELALFYVPEILPKEEQEGGEAGWKDVTALAKRKDELNRTVETVLFSTFKKRLIAPPSLLQGVTEIANLRGLYKIFERSC
ncbi:putative DNA mismatch repair protein Mlh1 [Choiromyces venosus 120613-1]|uniref:Putative DNA mismatch repair protein Mlh1 n=1 Tax=Choiromyces venosus 120613-1 TaxID=1336337 RepID=A0A3N4K4I3_9PEZI|nr:putative DNA mismatch repair protein Mlh1 [Choiromyces venosus 120613-1]